MADPVALYDEADKLKDDGKLDEAVAKLDEALAADPNYALAHSALAVVLQKLGRHEDAIEHAQKVCELGAERSVQLHRAERDLSAGVRRHQQHAVHPHGRGCDGEEPHSAKPAMSSVPMLPTNARIDRDHDVSPADDRYDTMTYNRCGRSGLKLPAISLGLWHNFGGVDRCENGAGHGAAGVRPAASRTSTWPTTTARRPARPRRTSAASCARTSARYRDELVISTKAGYLMWPGPYGEWGSRKYLLASLDQSLRRMGLEYVDIFYSPPPRSGDAAGGDDGRARHGRPQRQGALRRHLELPGRADPRRRATSCASWARRA